MPPRLSRALLKSLFSTRPSSAPSGTVTYANCPPVNGPAFRRYLRGLKRMSRGEHVPLVAHLSVTDRCSYHCGRCSNISAGEPDPPVESLARLLEELRAAGTASVALTGGEPCLRRDLCEIVEACGPELAPLLFTSGQEVDVVRARELRAAGLTAAFVSLDYFEPREHDRIRGSNSAFKAALRAIDACLQAGIYTAAQAVAGPALLAGAATERFLEFCKGLGVHDVVLLEPIPVKGAGDCVALSESSKDRLTALHLRAARDPHLPKVTAMPFLEGPEFLGCQAGFSFMYVSTGGEVFPCDFAPISFGNAYQLGLEPILERLAQHFQLPSRKCLALRVREFSGQSGKLPVLWPHTDDLMLGYEPGPPPELMKLILPRDNGAK